MQFFMDSNGVIQASFPHPVNQGGQDAYNIALYAPFAAGTVITASFKLPNGEIKGVYQLTEVGAVNNVKIAGVPARLWRMAIPGEITQYYGTVTAQFFVSTSGGTLPSSSTSFVVARGVPQVIDDTSPLDTITENIASLQSDLNNGYFSAKGLREWNALYTYGLGELVYVSEGDGNVLLESLKANNTDAPYTDGELNTASWKVALDKFVTPLSDDDPEMDGTAAAGSAPEAARADHVHPTDTTRASAQALADETTARQNADTTLQTNIDTEESARIAADNLKQDKTDSNLSTTAKTIVGAITENKSAIDGLQQDVINKDHFKGFAETAADVQEITGDANDFVYCIETGTIWTYGSSGWTDSNKPYPSDATPLATTTPLMDGTAAVGESSSAARADHVHPQDTVLAGKIEDIEDGTTPAGKVGHTLTVVVGDTTTTYDGSAEKTVNVPVAGIQGTLSATINGAEKTYDGSSDVELGSIYAPTSAGISGYLLKSNGNGAPVWTHVGTVFTGSCSTASSDSDKVIAVDGISLRDGTVLRISFTNTTFYSSLNNNLRFTVNNQTYYVFDKYGNHVTQNGHFYVPANGMVTAVFNNLSWTIISGLSGIVSEVGTLAANTSSTLSSSRINLGEGYDRIVTVWGNEASEYGQIHLRRPDTSDSWNNIASAFGEDGYWGASRLCITGYISSKDTIYFMRSRMNECYYVVSILGY